MESSRVAEKPQKPTKQEHDYAQMYLALKRILAYQSPARMRKNSERDWGLNFEECIEMAYENIQQEARNGIRGVRRPR